MYLHLTSYLLLRVIARREFGMMIFTIIGVLLPLLITKLVLERFRLTRNLLLGAYPPQWRPTASDALAVPR
jgi:hypothetical protein